MADRRLNGTVAVVTGASRGIGRAIAQRYADEGAVVVLASRSAEQLDDVAVAIRDGGGTSVAVPCDVTDDAQVEALAAEVAASVGFADVLVNNAGVYVPGRFLDYDLDDVRRVMDTNWLATWRVTAAFLPAMLREGRGRVINIASTAGKYGSMNQSAYNSSKHAVVGLTRCLALETARHGVRVNAICPGFVDTDLIGPDAVATLAAAMNVEPADVIPAVLQRVPAGRLVQPEEVAEMAVYLATPGADAVTGQALTVDGGMVLV